MSDLKLDVGLANELKMSFRRNGWTEEQIKKAAEGDFLGQVHRVLLGHALITVPEHLIDLYADPFVPDRWEVVEHQKGGQFTWDASKVGLYLNDGQKNGKYVKGTKLRKELSGLPVLNANALDYLLAHQHLIPEEWKGKAVFFWGTIYRNPHGDLFVRCLLWDGVRWRWLAYWLGRDWRGSFPAAVPAS